jgi:RND family efflux transporter MFP subunit
LRIVVEVPERDVPLVAVGTPAEIRFDAQPGMTVSGKVSRIAFTENPKTRTMRVEIDVPNADGKLHPGMFGAARLLLGKGPAGAWRVPASAVLTLLPPLGDAKSNAAVYVYRNGKAIMTRVQVAAQTEAEAEILSGLTANDRVVVDPKVLLPKDDVPVQVEPASAK